MYVSERSVATCSCMVARACLREPAVFNFDVKGLSECESAVAIVKAVMAVDDEASVYVRMATHRVEVTTATAGPRDLLGAISNAGFSAVLVPEEPSAASAWSEAYPRGILPRIPFEPDGTEFDSGDA
jgi:hypothetical protein